MRACWKILAASLCAAYALTTATTANSAEIAFSSQSDFTEINLNIKDTFNANPNALALEVTLSPDAQQRMQAASSAALEQNLTVIINGKAVNTARVMNVLDTPQLQITVSRQVAIELLPGLIGINPGGNLPADSVTTAPVIPTPGPASIPVPLLAAAPIAVQTQPVTSPSVTESAPGIAAMPAVAPEPPAAATDATDPVATPAAPITSEATNATTATTSAASLSAVAASTPNLPPSAAAVEPAAAPVVAALPPPPPAPPPVIPDWALGAWLPTSATPSQYADINVGDPVTIFANALDAITCNKARLSVLESSNGRVVLQMARNSQCVIGGVLVDRVQISPSVTGGRIVISFFAQQDDLNGTPAKQSVYRRK
ncbi:hypothetical protein CAter282_3670 [Collimonas arenae]|uniref:Uncharacterized protein n=1 Tax=Collimonas arenae TaxID=279058 RepID=A0A127QMV1_9BURK|nr:hypothetical protein [Collimonas arenae]AMP01452.1 hypothetical protein CAter10_4015 [Collimonas arenae]AMP11353.1 hypothetical protein CAter282_3670 [Collimonas arenae]